MAGKTTYDELVIRLVDEYLATTGREQTTLPKRESFARYIGVHRDTVNKWENENPEFKKALTFIDDSQKEQLMDDGMYGGKEVNSPMAIFLLKANHGMIETEKKVLEGNVGFIVPEALAKK